MNKAKAEIRLISTGLELNLSKTKEKRIIDEIKKTVGRISYSC